MELFALSVVRYCVEAYEMKGQHHIASDEMSEFLDGELELDEIQNEHLKSCPDCLDLLKRQQKLRRLARATRPDVPTEKMWGAIEGRLNEEPEPRRGFLAALFQRPRWVVAGTAGTVAASLLAIVLVQQTGELPGKAVPGTKAADRVVQKGITRTPSSEISGAPTPDIGGSSDEVVEMEMAEPDRAEKVERGLAPAQVPKARKKAAPFRQRSLAAPSMAAAPAEAPPRASFIGDLFLLEADKVDFSRKDVVVARGRVVVRPRNPGLAYFAVVDGFSRTLTGTQTGLSAEIRQPGDRLILRTGD